MPKSDTAAPALGPAARERTVGTVTTRLSLEPGHSRDVTFIVSWYFPNLHTRQKRMYTKWFKDAADVAQQLAKDVDQLRGETVSFCDSYYRGTTLPWWLASRLLMPVSTLATGTCQWWDSGRFWAWEGVCCCEGTCTHVWNYAQADAWLFPELNRSVRTMQDLGATFDEKTGLVGFRADGKFAADGQAGTVLKCYRVHLIGAEPRPSGRADAGTREHDDAEPSAPPPSASLGTSGADDAFLRRNWPRIKAALEYLIKEDGNDDGIIESDRQHNTYDINFVGPNTFVGSLYLAALRAGEEMATRMGDTDAAKRYHAIVERGSEWTVANLWSGEYFEQRVPPGNEQPWQYGRGCLSDQLFGQTWAHELNLGYLYPPEKVRSALAAVYKYNWAPDVGPLNAAHPPERWFARPGEPGLLICTWPRGGRPKEPVRYRDEVWTGIEYQVAAGLAWEGMTDEALAIVHGIEQRYDGARHNPWNEVECGDHYARALASWGVLHALAGFTYDGPAGRLGLSPRIQPDDFASFFCVGTGWGNLRQRRKNNTQTTTVDLRAGTLKLTQLHLAVPPGAAPNHVEALLADAADPTAQPRKVPARLVQSEDAVAADILVGRSNVAAGLRAGRYEVHFEAALNLRADQQLLVTLSW
jgi:uncharacterized protein (DUF608 family)